MTFSKMHIKTIKVHALCWSVYILYEILVSVAFTHQFSNFFYYLLFYLLNISLFYAHAFVLLPNSIGDTITTLWRLPLFFAIELMAYMCLFVLITLLLDHYNLRIGQTLTFNLRLFTGAFWRSINFVLYATGYYFLISYIKKKQRIMEEALEIKQLKLDLVKIEKDLLRAQINPHLLFNTLNFIKYTTKKRPEQADDAIVKLSELMSYALEKSNSGFTAIGRELKQADNMIRLNQLRFDNKLHVNYHTDVSDENIQIIPVVLLTLIENVFKHGDLHNPDFPALIDVMARPREILIKTANLCASTHQTGDLHTGLNNITSRLAIAYPNHNFVYGTSGNIFETRLHICMA